MIITIQPLPKKGYVICIGHRFAWAFPKYSQYEITKFASELTEDIFKQEGIRPMIKILPIQHTPMATKTPPAKKAKALKKLAKKKKAVKKKK